MDKKIKKKCKHCRKKLSLISFTCKCGHLYCITHQNPHIHNCSYNYLKENKQKLEKDNPKIESSMDKKLLK